MIRTEPLAYFLTWTCYGTWLHGDRRGSVDSEHNVVDTPFVEEDSRRRQEERGRLHQGAVLLKDEKRRVVSETIVAHCRLREWELIAVHVRTNHVHVVVGYAGLTPEVVMGQLKSWTTRRLRDAGLWSRDERVWTKHGSTRYLWKASEIEQATAYVVEGQGSELRGQT